MTKALPPERLHSVNDMVEKALALHRNLAALPQHLPPLNEQRFVEEMLSFADESASLRARLVVERYLRGNISSDLPIEARDKLFQIYEAGLKSPKVWTESRGHKLRQNLDAWWSSVAEDRSIFRDTLEALLSDADAIRAELEPVFQEQIRKILVVPVLRRDDGRTALNLYLRTNHSEAVWYYVLMLLLDDSKDYGERLSRCRYPDCSRFFLRTAQNRFYCSEEHALLGAAAKNASRQKKHRGLKKARKAK